MMALCGATLYDRVDITGHPLQEDFQSGKWVGLYVSYIYSSLKFVWPSNSSSCIRTLIAHINICKHRVSGSLANWLHLAFSASEILPNS